MLGCRCVGVLSGPLTPRLHCSSSSFAQLRPSTSVSFPRVTWECLCLESNANTLCCLNTASREKCRVSVVKAFSPVLTALLLHSVWDAFLSIYWIQALSASICFC